MTDYTINNNTRILHSSHSRISCRYTCIHLQHFADPGTKIPFLAVFFSGKSLQLKCIRFIARAIDKDSIATLLQSHIWLKKILPKRAEGGKDSF
jgi:hypothetical protein